MPLCLLLKRISRFVAESRKLVSPKLKNPLEIITSKTEIPPPICRY